MGFTQHLRERGEDGLTALLAARPDLANPRPSSVPSLAARAAGRASLERALAPLDAWSLQLLEAVLALAELREGVTGSAVAEAVGASEDDCRTTLVTLGDLALTWFEPYDRDADPMRTTWHPTPGLADVLGPYPAGLGPTLATALGRRSPAALARLAEETDLAAPDDSSTETTLALLIEHLSDRATVTRLLDDAPAAARRVLTALTWGPPVGHASGGQDSASPARAGIQWALRHGLLSTSDAQHVVLPREIALALRDGRTHRGPALCPRPVGRPVEQPDADADAARHAEEIVRLVDAVVDRWGTQPPPLLRSGGLGVRELRKLAAHLQVIEPTAAFVVEIAYTAGLVADEGESPATAAPTTEVDEWLPGTIGQRWTHLARAWLGSQRAAWLVGTRDESGMTRSALDPELTRPWVPRLRKSVLRSLDETALDPDQVLEILRWRAPRSAPAEHTVRAVMEEAAMLGLLGAGVLSSAGRALVDGVDARHLLDAALPPTVDEILLQGDLTGVVPGRPSPSLSDLLTAAAQVESRGSALTVRFTEETVRAAMDAGHTADDLTEALARHARTGVPQPLAYLVQDVARRHGRVRVGTATCYVRSQDPTFVAALVGDAALRSELGLLAVAPTVVVAQAAPGAVVEALRARGMAPVLEDANGTVVVAGARPHRVEPRSAPADVTTPAAEVTDRRLRELATDLLSADHRAPAATAPDTSRRSWDPGDPAAPAYTLGVLAEAADEHKEVVIEVVGPGGATSRRRVRPLRVDAGRVRVLDLDRDAELIIAAHRIVDVTVESEG